MTPLMELADIKLGGGLEDFVRSRRTAPKRPWRLIAIDLRDATGIDITDETLRVWFPEAPEAVAS